MSKPIRFRPKAQHFKSRGERAAYFRELDRRTDRKARRNREFWELDRKRIEAGPLAPHNALASPTDAHQAGR